MRSPSSAAEPPDGPRMRGVVLNALIREVRPRPGGCFSQCATAELAGTRTFYLCVYPRCEGSEG